MKNIKYSSIQNIILTLLLFLIYSHSSAIDIKDISLLNISLGDNMKMAKHELGKVFLNEKTLKERYPSRGFNNVTELRCTSDEWIKDCTGAFSMTEKRGHLSRFKEKYINVKFNKSTGKAYDIQYSQGANVADDRNGCESVIKTQLNTLKKEYGDDFRISMYSAFMNNDDSERYRVRFECSGGFIQKTVDISSEKLKKVTSEKSSLD